MPNYVPENLIGNAPEIVCKVNNVETLSLIDTGSQITSIAHSFFQQHFSDQPLQEIAKLLRIESVSGQNLPYHGYFECTISVPVTDSQNLHVTVPVLVVPNTKYNTSVPLLLGTNVLNLLLTFPEPTAPSLKLAVKSLNLENRHLAKTCGVYGNVYAAEDMSVQPYSGKVSFGKATVAIPICQQIALLQEHSESISIVPSLVNIKHGSNSVPFEIFNDSDTVLHISKGDQIANLHQASVQIEPSVDHSQFLDSLEYSHLGESETVELKKFLVENRDVFAMNIQEMGCTDVVEHHIDLTDETPFKDKTRPIPPGMYEEVRSHIAELLSAGVIQESQSPYSSNIVLVRKKDGSLRLCIDYRRLNTHSIRDSYNIPRIETLIDSLRGAKYFASLDLFAGYHQVKVFEPHRERTAFSTICGFYEHVKMPFGLKNSPSTFQRMMEKVLDGLIMNICAVYLDDVIVYAKTKSELYDNLATIFDRFRNANLRLKPKKCKFFQDSVEFLGHQVSADGVQCSDKHIAAVSDWAEPKDVKELQTFLGFANFFRRFVPGFAHVANPLTQLLKGHCHKKRSYTKSKKSKSKSVSEPAPWQWGPAQIHAFNSLKSALCSPPCLAYPDFSKPFQLHCDASRVGLGAALYQTDDSGKLHPVAYGSRSLTGSERNYSAYKLEFLALKWAVTVKFTYYLYNNEFKIFTDHNPLVYLTTSAKLDALGHRWLAELSSYHFSIHYKPGIQNRDADALSRRPDPEKEQSECTNVVNPEIFKELCNLVNSSDFSGVAEISGVAPSAMSNAIPVSHVDTLDWSAEQRKDTDLCRVLHLVSKNIKLTDRQRRRESPGVMRLLSYWKRLLVKNDILYVKSTTLTGEKFDRLVVPRHIQDQVLTKTHEDLGHLGRDKTLSVAQERFFWVGLSRSVEDKIKQCRRCICAKSPHLPERAPLVSIVTSRPLELVCMDFLSLEESKGRIGNILVITDHYTKYAVAIPTRTQEAKCVAKHLFDSFIVHYGIPERLHSDQGGSFEGRVIKHLCQILGVKKSRTTPYHPEGDGVTERFNRTLISMLKTLDPDRKSNWKDHVAPLVHAYNCCRHETTHFTPFYLMFGRCPRLPIDIFLGVPEPDVTNSASSIRQNLKAAYQAATDATKQAQKRQAKSYNKKVRGNTIDTGDYVLVKNVGIKGKHKLADRWKPDLYIVTEHPNKDIPVFKVRPENGSGEKVLHRNMLLPLNLPWPQEIVSEEIENVENTSELSDDSFSDLEVQIEDLPIPQVDSDNGIVDIADVSIDDQDNQSVANLDVSAVEVPFPVSPPPTADVDSLPGHIASPSPVSVHEPSLSPSGANDSSDQRDAHANLEESPELRRSARNHRPPVFFKDYVSYGQIVHILDWQVKVAALLQMLPLFPMHHADICHSILYVISHV